MNYQLIAKHAELSAAVGRLSLVNPLAVDMEMENNLHHYGLHLALVQIATPANAVFVFDPVSLGELKPLGELLASGRHELIMQGADFDRRTCFQLHGWILDRIFDTQIAAMFCGFKQTGLGNMLDLLFGVKTDKKFQRQDWMRRPLSKAALEYAAKDVGFLHALREHLTARLIELKRLDWALEEMVFAGRNIIDDSPTPTHCRVKNSSSLTPRQLAVLKALCAYRETMAKFLDRPAHFVARDQILMEIVMRPPQDEKAVHDIRGLHPALYHRPAAEGLLEAIREGMKAPEETHHIWRGRKISPVKGWEERLKNMRAWRTEISRELDLEPHLVFSAEVMAWCARNPGRELLPVIAGNIRDWQKKSFWPEFQKRFMPA